MFVYLIFNGFHYKIGISSNWQRRIKQLQTGSGNKLEIIAIKEVRDRKAALSLEKDIHIGLRQHRKNGEWFDLPISKLDILKKELLGKA